MSGRPDEVPITTVSSRKNQIFSHVEIVRPGQPFRSRAVVREITLKEEYDADLKPTTTTPQRRRVKDPDGDLYCLSPDTPRKKKRKLGGLPKTRVSASDSAQMYSHLKPLPDHLDYDLDIVFCGINPGKLSATTGHHFSKSSNSFWKCLRDSGLTPGTLIPPDQDYTLPERYRYGLTNVVERPSTSESELSASEKAACVVPCLTKIMRYRPKILCILGIGIWQVIEKQLKSLSTLSGLRLETPPNPEDVSPPVIIGEKSVAMGDNVGLRPYVLAYKAEDGTDTKDATLIFVTINTSGVATIPLVKKVEAFIHLRQLLDKYKFGEVDISNAIKIYFNATSDSEDASSQATVKSES